ncbi:uncharacterized protein LOC131941308 [Physella acuta]|uniref:uncharacterized protein LOC131941308 n=1 Tax=Physella acuta TaxID=109671 RepID=UPI0027DCD1E7|nr:uncharacterized protein LOC131941308 [Physella acuta]
MGHLFPPFVFLVSVVGLTLAAYQGCYLESVRRRHFSVSPGDYSPEVTTTLSCMANCGTFKYMYAAVTSGKFCYCASTLPAAAPVNDTYCDMPCIGDKNQRCGGVKHVSVYTASKKISGLTISTSVENTIIKVADPVTINVSIASGNEVVYRMDYDDGAGQATPNATNMLSMAYYVPGEYSIMVYANNINRTFKDEVAVTTVRVDAPPGETTVSCDPVFATYELGACTLTVWWGSSLQLNVTINTFSYFFGIEDPPLSLAGASVPAKGANPGNSNQQVYVMPAAEFTVSGKVIGWQMYLDTLGTGKLTVLILKPTCSSGTYCYSRNTCSSSCESSTAKVVSCATGQQFCGQASKCYSSCAQTVSRYASLPMSYQVEPGYIMGLQQDSGASVLARISSTADTSDRMFTYSSTTVSQSFVSSGGTVITARHAITAVASAGSKVYLPFRFQTSGNFTLSAVVSSRTLTNVATSSASTSVLVLDGVNASIIQAPVYTATRKVVVFLLDPHTGSDLYYNWTISDGTKFLQTRNSSLSYTFNSSGIYDVNVTIYNSISQKSNGTTVYALDEVTGVFMYSNTTVRGLMTPVLVNVVSGTNYTCTYDYGDNTGRQNSGLLSGPMANATKSYTYATPGVYSINITCSNQVSRGTHVLQVKVQDLISNLQLLTLGANTNQNFFIIWQVDAGTALNFALTLNGIALTNFSQVSAYKWQTSLQPGRGNMVLPLVLRAWNDVSTQQISTNFTILTAIANPTFTTNVANASSYDDVYFVANISAGSDVTVTVDYGDGYNDTYTQPLNTNWPGAQTFVHKYFNGGRFTVRATFRNAGGSQTRSVEMLVLVGVGMINCNLDEYALYHPPALVNLMFTAPALPTEPTLTINWGELTSRDTQPALEMNKNYSYQYRDTGTYKVMARLQNIMGTKTCLKPVTVVEKLAGPFFLPQFPAAALDLPYEVVFCLFRGPTGDLCNMTFDFGDGKGPLVIQRTGNGKNQCDARNVTYNSKGSRTIKVTATSPLETVSLSYTVDVIRGIKDPYVSVTTSGDVIFGNPTTFTLTYSDPTLPDNANFTLDFGDNSTTDAGPYFLTSSTLTVRHTYVKDGLLTATAVLSNAASRAVRQLMVGVYREFQNLKAQAYYLAEIPPNETVFGFNNGSRLYPQNVPTYFIVTDDNNAYASHYNVTITDSTSKSTNYQKFSRVFDISFPKMDTFRVSITAYNPMFSASITPMTLILVELIENFTVVEYNLKARANEYKYFNVSFNKIGSGTCLYVDYNDGVKEIYANDLTLCTDSSFSSVAEADKHAMTDLLKPRSGVLNHTYGSDGEYVFTATAKNSQSEVKLTITFSISGFDCARPTVNIHNRRPYFTAPEVYKRSQKLTVRGLTNIQCVASLANVKSWRVERIDERWSTVIENISLANLDTTKAEVTFPPRFFDLGLYRVYYTMEMTGAGAPGGSAYSSTTFTHIKITKTDLIGIMVAGGVSEIQRGTAQRLDLNPTDYSLDPDVSPNVTQGLTVTGWVCENLDSPTDTTSYLAGGFNMTGQTQSLDISKFQLSRYRITVYLAKDTRKTSAILYLKVVEGDPPTATISPATGSVYYQIADGYKVLQSSRVALDCSCDNCGQSESYRWTVYMADYRWPSGWRPLLDDDLYGRVSGGNSKQISIESSLFETFKAERMRAECNITSGSTSGKVATNLQINKPPIPGSCTVSPYNRTITTEQAWTINVTGWYDDDGIQEYQFFVHTDNSTVDKQITSYKTDKGSLVLSVRIPEGPDYLNYTQSVIVKVRDNLAATKDFNCGNIVVTPMPQSDIRALAQEIASTQLGEINKMFAEGDQKTCTERATSIMSLLNSDKNANSPVNFANTMYGESDSNRVYYQQANESLQEQKEFVYQVESERNDRAAVRGMIINQMANLAVKDIVSVMEMSSTYAEATKYGDEIDQASQKNVMDSLQSMSDFINDPDSIDNVPSEEIESAMRYIVATTACIMDAAGSNGQFGLQSELAKAKEDPTWKDYDTSISALEDEDAPDLSSATSFDEALQMQSARVHKIRQAKTVGSHISHVTSIM